MSYVIHVESDDYPQDVYTRAIVGPFGAKRGAQDTLKAAGWTEDDDDRWSKNPRTRTLLGGMKMGVADWRATIRPLALELPPSEPGSDHP